MTRRNPCWAAVFLVCAFVVWSIADAGRFLSSPAQAPDKADVIVALGGDVGERVHAAQALFAEGYAPRILLTGLEEGSARTRPAYLNWRASFLLERGVPISAIFFDTRSLNSLQEAVNTLQLMKEKGWQRVIVVSDPPHLRRLQMAWEKAFAGSGLSFSLYSTSPPWWSARAWWSNEKSAMYVMNEYVKLLYYCVRYF